MFFIVSKLLGPLVSPLTYITACLVIALACYRRPAIGRTSLIIAIVLLFVFGTPFLPDALMRRLENRYAAPETLPPVDAIIVLAGMLDVSRSSFERLEFNESAERIVTGMQLWRQGAGKMLLIIGGSGDLYDQTKSESVLLRQLAIDCGIPADRILIDPDSRNTYENAVNARELMRRHGLTTSVLVTSATHLPRAMGCFRRLGAHPIPYPVDFTAPDARPFRLGHLLPGISGLRHTNRLWHESLGLLMYKLAGYI